MSNHPLRPILNTFVMAVFILLPAPPDLLAQPDGWIHAEGRTLFPLGSYELPKEDSKLAEMAEAGINLVRCQTREDLDRLHRHGLFGVISLGLDSGPTEDFQKMVLDLKDHPALRVWEGPDEIIWNITAYSGLHRTMGIYPHADEWKRQTDIALDYSEKKAAEVIPKMKQAADFIRSVDTQGRPIWINEALHSDPRFVRECLKFIDITGCDTYPVKADRRPIGNIGPATDLWNKIGQGKPVWMVLQAFSWNELGEYYGHTEVAYPTFSESRYMAYASILHGADGILYWGTHFLKSAEFRQSLYALTSELAALQPFLVADDLPLEVELIEEPLGPESKGVRGCLRQSGEESVLILINEDDQPHLGVEVSGLGDIEGKTLELLYGREQIKIEEGAFMTRLVPHQVKVFATSRQWESEREEGRDFGKRSD